jgi:hypothetical protein
VCSEQVTVVYWPSDQHHLAKVLTQHSTQGLCVKGEVRCGPGIAVYISSQPGSERTADVDDASAGPGGAASWPSYESTYGHSATGALCIRMDPALHPILRSMSLEQMQQCLTAMAQLNPHVSTPKLAQKLMMLRSMSPHDRRHTLSGHFKPQKGPAHEQGQALEACRARLQAKLASRCQVQSEPGMQQK